MAKVYIVFDPAGIYELDEPVYASRERAEQMCREYVEHRNAFGVYKLYVKEYEVQP